MAKMTKSSAASAQAVESAHAETVAAEISKENTPDGPLVERSQKLDLKGAE